MSKRLKKIQESAAQNSQLQKQQAQEAAQFASQVKIQEMQMESEMELKKMQLKSQMEAQLEQVRHQFRKEIELIKAQATLGFKTEDQEFKEKLEVLKENRKDERVEKQASEQSKLLSQRQGKRGELADPGDSVDNIVNSLLD